MLRVGRYLFKRAEASHEFDEIHRLNYRTFVAEIPQHPDTGSGLLVDKFHDKNVYFIGLRDAHVVGMVSAHACPPFSVAHRMPDPTLLERPGTRPFEVRLLAIEPSERNGIVLVGLLWELYDHAREHGYTDVYISGVTERVDLYARLGFRPLGPAVPCGSAAFTPMAVTFTELQRHVGNLARLWQRHTTRINADPSKGGAEWRMHAEGEGAAGEERPLICLLPGPVTISAAVREAFHQPPIYHRGPEFIGRFERVRRLLGDLVGGRDVALFNGSGTLANETVAATLAAEIPVRGSRGILLVNGEFGERLARQATRFGLNPRVLRWPWGSPWNLDEVDAALAEEPAGSWVWGVHLESSTGVLNDLSGLARLAKERGARVCADCVSSLGAVPLDLRGVFLATGATGKSLGAYAGMAIVFADGAALPRTDPARLPSYFDVAAALATVGPRYTFPSPTLRAVEAALAEYATPEQARARYDHYEALGSFVRGQLREVGIAPLAEEGHACPVVTTFVPPGEETCAAFVARCRSWGFLIGGQSGYLAERRLVQVATMGAVRREEMAPFFEALGRWLSRTAVLAG